MFIAKHGGYYYVFHTTPDGKRHKSSTHCTRKRDALRVLQEFDPDKQAAPRVSLSGFTSDFLQYARSTCSSATLELFVRVLKSFAAATGDHRLADIKPIHVDQFKSARLRDVSATTANIELRALRSIFNTAIRWGLLPASPFQKVSLPKIPQTVPTYLTREEYDAYDQRSVSTGLATSWTSPC